MEDTTVKSRLIEAATAEFLSHGFERANVGRIATAAGISKKTVYKFFNSKEVLLYASMQASMNASLVGIGPFDPSVPPLERLSGHLMAFAELAFSAKGITSYRLFMSEGMRFKELARLYVDALSLFGIEPLARDLKAYVAAGKLAMDDPALSARMLMAMVFAEPMRDAGLGVSDAPEAKEVKKLIATAVTLFLRGTEPRV